MSKKNVLLAQSKLTEVLDEFVFDPGTSLDDRMEVLAQLFTEQAVRAISSMSGKDAMIGAGIAIDKMRLLRGLPEDIKDAIPMLVEIAFKLSEENIALKTFLSKTLAAMNEP